MGPRPCRISVPSRTLRRHVATWEFKATKEDELSLRRVSDACRAGEG